MSASDLSTIAMIGALSDVRHDNMVSRQGVMNHQNAAHMMDLAFIRDLTELSIPESYAVQGLANTQGTRDAQAQNLAAQTPKT